MGFEYDPYNKLRHTTYWYEKSIEEEWIPNPMNTELETKPQPDDVFDYNAKPTRFYIDVETDGSLGPKEVVMRVSCTGSTEPTSSSISYLHRG